MIAIVNYQMGNLGSVAKALAYIGCESVITSDPEQVAAADRVILPGVGAMTYAMTRLRSAGLDQAIRNYIKSGKPFLGICLGMQLMFEASEEGQATGLGILKGSVVRFPRLPGIKVPHMGWNELTDCRSSLLKAHAHYYFVHSYYVKPADPAVTAAVSDHGIPFTAAVRQDQLLLTQFHPEKSGDVGLELLRNWLSER